MPKWVLGAILGTTTLALVLSAAVAYRVFGPHNGAIVVKAVPPGGDPANVGSNPMARARVFRTAYQYVDRETGQQRDVVLQEETDRIARFIRLGNLTGDQERDIRDRYAKMRDEEDQLAQKMVKAGEWSYEPYRQTRAKFWSESIRKLPGTQAQPLLAEFMPLPTK